MMAPKRFTYWQMLWTRRSVGSDVWRRVGFTLIELMVVVLIVGILAAVAIPILRGRSDAAKWSEGKVMLGTIATAIRAYAGEKGPGSTDLPTALDVGATGLGFDVTNGDLDGTYFSNECFSFECTSIVPVVFTITCDATKSTRPEPPTTPSAYTLNQSGHFEAIP